MAGAGEPRDAQPAWRAAALAAYGALAFAAIGLLLRQALLGAGWLALGVQAAAAGLMVAARLALGRRSFHVGAAPTPGGLVTRGPYRWIRHPVYAAVLAFLAAGALSHGNAGNGLLLGLAVAASAVRMAAEEGELRARYPEYTAYAARTRRLVPGVF